MTSQEAVETAAQDMEITTRGMVEIVVQDTETITRDMGIQAEEIEVAEVVGVVEEITDIKTKIP